MRLNIIYNNKQNPYNAYNCNYCLTVLWLHAHFYEQATVHRVLAFLYPASSGFSRPGRFVSGLEKALLAG